MTAVAALAEVARLAIDWKARALAAEPRALHAESVASAAMSVGIARVSILTGEVERLRYELGLAFAEERELAAECSRLRAVHAADLANRDHLTSRACALAAFATRDRERTIANANAFARAAKAHWNDWRNECRDAYTRESIATMVQHGQEIGRLMQERDALAAIVRLSVEPDADCAYGLALAWVAAHPVEAE